MIVLKITDHSASIRIYRCSISLGSIQSIIIYIFPKEGKVYIFKHRHKHDYIIAYWTIVHNRGKNGISWIVDTYLG